MAGNVLNFYDPLFYAQEALIVLEKELGFAARIHRGYEPSPQQKGSVINISKPGTFTAQNAPGSVAQDVATGGVSITLDTWKEVKFKLTDKELTFTKEKIVNDHIRPAAYALADSIDMRCASLYQDIYKYGGTVSADLALITDLTRVRRMFQDQMVPDDGQRHLAINNASEEALLALATFNANAGVPSAAQEAFLKGSLGSKFSYEIFSSLNIPTHTNGTVVSGNLTGTAGATVGSVGTVSVSGGTVTKGTLFTIAGNTTVFVVTADVTATTTTIAALNFAPALPAGFSPSAAAMTFIGTHANNIGFHRNAFALAMAPLSELGNNLGVRMNTLSFNDLSLRSKVWYDADSSELRVSLDCLYGIKTLDPQLAFRFIGKP
jgi:hypothetical protein